MKSIIKNQFFHFQRQILLKKGRCGNNTNFCYPTINQIKYGHFTESSAKPDAETVKFTFIRRDNSLKQVQAKQGQHILEIAKRNDVQLQGACQASLACSTCHVILPKDIFEKLQAAVDEEEDLLDLAFGLTSTSRLGCQVKVCKQMEGCVVTLPKSSRNMYVDGTKPSSH